MTFTDPSGLKADNVSSAYDLSRLITFAATDPKIARSSPRSCAWRNTTVSTSRRTVHINNTNRLVVDGDVDVMAREDRVHLEGRSLSRDAAPPAAEQPQVAVVVLGATSNTGRFWETRHLFNWLSKTADLFKEQTPGIKYQEQQLVACVRGLSAHRYLNPFWMAAASSGSVATESTAGITGSRRVARVVGLQIALAYVAAVQAILSVAARERRDTRAVRVQAERARELLEPPPCRAASADQQPVRRRGDHREVGFASTERAGPALPSAEIASRHDRVARARQEGAHGLLEQRLEAGGLGADGRRRRAARLRTSVRTIPGSRSVSRDSASALL